MSGTRRHTHTTIFDRGRMIQYFDKSTKTIKSIGGKINRFTFSYPKIYSVPIYRKNSTKIHSTVLELQEWIHFSFSFLSK